MVPALYAAPALRSSHPQMRTMERQDAWHARAALTLPGPVQWSKIHRPICPQFVTASHQRVPRRI